jgi:hypothetical protein
MQSLLSALIILEFGISPPNVRIDFRFLYLSLLSELILVIVTLIGMLLQGWPLSLLRHPLRCRKD